MLNKYVILEVIKITGGNLFWVYLFVAVPMVLFNPNLTLEWRIILCVALFFVFWIGYTLLCLVTFPLSVRSAENRKKYLSLTDAEKGKVVCGEELDKYLDY